MCANAAVRRLSAALGSYTRKTGKRFAVLRGEIFRDGNIHQYIGITLHGIVAVYGHARTFQAKAFTTISARGYVQVDGFIQQAYGYLAA